MSANLDPMANGGDAVTPLVVPQAKRKMPSQVPLLLLLVGVSAGALYWMRSQGVKAGFKFEQVALEIKDEDSAKARTYERIMADLARVQNPLDVTLTEFGRSPFMRESARPTVTPDAGPIAPDMSEAERRRAEAVDRLKRMKLRGIIGKVARIDDHTVRVGDALQDGYFIVTGIDGRSVSFEAYGETFTLTLEPPAGTGPKRSPTDMGSGGPGR